VSAPFIHRYHCKYSTASGGQQWQNSLFRKTTFLLYMCLWQQHNPTDHLQYPGWLRLKITDRNTPEMTSKNPPSFAARCISAATFVYCLCTVLFEAHNRRHKRSTPEDMIKTEKIFHLKSFRGRKVRVVREHYLREHVPCYSALCQAGCHNGKLTTYDQLHCNLTVINGVRVCWMPVLIGGRHLLCECWSIDHFISFPFYYYSARGHLQLQRI